MMSEWISDGGIRGTALAGYKVSSYSTNPVLLYSVYSKHCSYIPLPNSGPATNDLKIRFEFVEGCSSWNHLQMQ